MRDKTEPPAPSDHFIQFNGLTFRYREWGHPNASTIVVLHGFHQRAEFWDSVAGGLQDHYRVIVLDQRGHGLSDWAEDYRPEAWVDDVATVVDAIGLKQFALIGHSMGGRHAWAFAARCPQRVERLVIIDIGPRGTEPESSAPPALVRRLLRFPAWVRFSLLRSLRHRAQRVLTGRRPDFDPRLRTAPARPAREWEQLGSIRCPTLLVRGEESDVLSHAGACRMMEAARNCRLVEIPRSGHLVHWDNAEALLAALREFMEQQGP